MIILKLKICAKYYNKVPKFAKIPRCYRLHRLLYTKICQSKHIKVQFFGKNIEISIC